MKGFARQSPPRSEMRTKAAYQRFLAQSGLSEFDVPPIMPMPLIESAKQCWGKSLPPDDTWQQFLSSLESNSNVLIEGIAGSLEERLSSLGAPRTPIPYYAGVFPTNSFNAQAVLIDDVALILIDTGCFSVLEALILLWGCVEDVQESLQRAAKIVVDYVDNYVAPEPTKYDHPDMHRDGYKLLAYSMIVTKTEEFVIGHELGHLRFGHLLGQRAPGTGGIYTANRSWDDEISADIFSLDLLTHQRDGLDLRTGCAGPYVFFATARLLERVRQRGSAERLSWTDTHPPSIMRAAVLERALSELGLLEIADLGQRFNWWAEECASLIERS